MALVLVSDRPRLFQFVPDGSGQGLIDHTTPGTTPDPHAMYATDTDLANHVGNTDPHAANYTKTAVNTLFTNHGSATDPHPTYAFDSDLSNHVAAADPHPVYATDTDVAGKAPLLHAVRHKVGAADDISADFVPWANVGSAGGVATFGHTHPPTKILGPYRATNGAALASAATDGRTAASVVIPDPGFPWIPVAFGQLEARVGAVGTRAAAGIFRGSAASTANAIAWGAGFDPVNQGSGGNGYWLISCIPYGLNDLMANPVAAGETAANRTIILSPWRDYGSANIDSTAFKISLVVFVIPA